MIVGLCDRDPNIVIEVLRDRVKHLINLDDSILPPAALHIDIPWDANGLESPEGGDGCFLELAFFRVPLDIHELDSSINEALKG